MQLDLSMAHHRLSQQAARQYVIGSLTIPQGSPLPALAGVLFHDGRAPTWLNRAMNKSNKRRILVRATRPAGTRCARRPRGYKQAKGAHACHFGRKEH